MAFLTMSAAELFHSFNMRSQRQSIFTLGKVNRLLWGSLAVSLLLTLAVTGIPVFAAAFGFASVSLGQYAIAILIGSLVIPIVELVKLVQRKRRG